MFKDYYKILEINEYATPEEIKDAFKKQALKWHPDRNPGKDTTKIMQDINEAYLILKDEEARVRYNKEYQRYKNYRNEQAQHEKEYSANDDPQYESSNFKVNDDTLNRWMHNAKRQAVGLAKQSLDDLVGMATAGAKAGIEKAAYLVISGLVLFTIFSLSKACNQKVYSPPTTVSVDSIRPVENSSMCTPKTNTIKLKNTRYQVFENDNFIIKCECKLNANPELSRVEHEDPTSAYIGYKNINSFKTGIIYNATIIDESKAYENIAINRYAHFDSSFLKSYISQLQTIQANYVKIKFQNVPAVEYTYLEKGLPAKAIIFLKGKKFYTLQVATRNQLISKFNAYKNSFQFISGSG